MDSKGREDDRSSIRRRKIDKVTKFDKANKGSIDKIDKTSWEKLQMFDQIKRVAHEYRGLLQCTFRHLIRGGGESLETGSGWWVVHSTLALTF